MIHSSYQKACDNARKKFRQTAMDVFVTALMDLPEKEQIPRLQAMAACRKKDTVSVMQRDLAAALLA